MKKTARRIPPALLALTPPLALLVLGVALGPVLVQGAGSGAATRGIRLENKTAPPPPVTQPTAETTAQPPGQPAAGSGGVLRALLIGNNDYRAKKWPKLKTAAKDVQEIANVLISRYGYQPENVRVIHNATRRQMMRGFLTIAGAAKPEDSVFIYYAGHGEYDKNERGWWVPVDGEDSSNYISNEEVLANLRSIKAKHKLLVADSCFSGNLLTRGARDTTAPELPLKGYFREKDRLASVQGLSSGGNEPVSDGGAEWQGHSIFAYHLLGVLKANQKRYLSSTLLGYQLSKTVANDTASALGVGQTPILSSVKNQGDQGGEFFFLPQDLGPVIAIPVTIFYPHSGDKDFDALAAPARETIALALGKLMDNYGMQVKAVRQVAPASLEADMAAALRENKGTAALVLSLQGERKKEATLMWQGVASLGMSVAAYRFKQGQLKKIGAAQINPQLLPFRRWSDDPETIKGTYRDTAEKLVKRWSRAELNRVLGQFED